MAQMTFNSEELTKWTLYGGVCVIVGIGLGDIFLNHFEWLPWVPLQLLFNITREDSFANWFSSLIALAAGIVAMANYWVAKGGDLNNGGDSRRGIEGPLPWAIIGLFFIFVGFDDGTSFHERIGNVMTTVAENNLAETDVGDTWLDWFPTYPWQLFVAPFFGVMGCYIAWALHKALPVDYFRWILAALSVMAIAIGMDFLEGMKLEPLDNYEASHSLKLIEELLEMVGTLFFLLVFMKVLFDKIDITIRLK